jgi:hypothetical protein
MALYHTHGLLLLLLLLLLVLWRSASTPYLAT